MAAMSVASAMAGNGARSRLYRPTNSAAMWAASVALPPFPKSSTLWPSRKAVAISLATSTMRSACSRTNCCLTAALSAKALMTKSFIAFNSRRGLPSCQTRLSSRLRLGRDGGTGLPNGVHGHGDHRTDVGDAGRKNERIVRLGQLAEFGDVLFGDPQLHRFLASGDLNGLGDLAQPLGRGLRNGEDRGGRSFCFVDLLLFLGFGGLDDLLLLAFGLIDDGVTLALGRENDGPLLPLRTHLLFHRVEYALRRGDVLDLVPKHLDAPGVRCLVEFIHHLDIDVGPSLEGPVELDL